MNSQTHFSKQSLFRLIVIGALIGLGLPLLANTPVGKELYADAWLNVATLVLMLGIYSFIIVKGRENRNDQQNFLSSVSLVLLAVLVIYQSSHNWQYLPWGRASAFKTANNFMVAMNLGDYQGATQYMKPCVREKVGTDVLRDKSQTRPISWQFTDYERAYSFVSTIGTAKLVDGTETRIEFKMAWNGFRWEVFSVIFGEPYKDAIIQFAWGC